MAKFTPFIQTPDQQIVPVGSTETGKIYLLKKGGLSPNESPYELQELEKRQAKLQMLIQRAVRKMAKEEGLSRTEATNRLFNIPVKSAESGEGDRSAVEAESAYSLFDFFSEQDAEQFLLLQDSKSVPYKAASLFIRYRLAYPVEIAENRDQPSDSPSVKIKAPWFDVGEGDRLKFGKFFVTVTGNPTPVDGEDIFELPIQPPKSSLIAGEIGFLCEEGSCQEKIGDSTWTEDDTKENLLDSQITAIYTFYQSEAGELRSLDSKDEEAEAPDEGKS